MRFLKIYLGTMIIVFIICIFVYAMSFVYVQSVQTTLGTDVSVLEMTENDNDTTFYILGNSFTANADEIDNKVNELADTLPCEISAVVKALKTTGDFFENLYNNAFNG